MTGYAHAGTLLYPTPIFLTGLSHHGAPVAEREIAARLSSPPFDPPPGSGAEVVVVSTCNRFEIIAAGEAASGLAETRLREAGVSPGPGWYRLRDRDAVRHLFRVVSGCDSAVVGEAQILGQVKDAYRAAVRRGTVGKVLHHLFQFSFGVAKRARYGTGVGSGPVSVGYVAARLAASIFDDLASRTAVVIGGGALAELVVLHLRALGCRHAIVANRTVARAAELAGRLGGTAASLGDIPGVLAEADVVIGSASVDAPVVTPESLALRPPGRPLFLVDLGVPRNFSPRLADLDDVYLYDVDDLARVADANRAKREDSARDALVTIDHGVIRFERWLTKVTAEPKLVSFRESVRRACEEAVRAKATGVVAPDRLEAFVEELVGVLAPKLAHETTRLVAAREGGIVSAEDVFPVLIDTLLGR